MSAVGVCMYFISCVCLGRVGLSEVYTLKSVGESTPPYGTPVSNWRCVDVEFLKVTYKLCVP